MDYKTFTSVPAWVDAVKDEGAILGANDAYKRVPIIYRCVDLRANSLSSIPYTLSRGDTQSEWIYPQKLEQLLWQIEAALSLSGQAFILKLHNGRRVVGLQWLNPATMKVEYKNGELSFTQTVGSMVRQWSSDMMIHVKKYNPDDDLTTGTAPAAAASLDAELLHYTNMFTDKFFEGGAMPAVIIGIDGNPSPDDIKKLESRFGRMISGVKRAFGVLAVRSVVKPEVITPPIESLTLTDLRGEARLSIAQAFGVPITMLTDAANYATAKEHRLSFYQDTILPELKQIESAFNEQLLNDLGYTLLFNPQALDIFQEDESARAGSLTQLVTAGMPLKLGMEILGYDLTDEQWAELETVTDTAPPVETQAQADIQKSDIAKWRRKATSGMKRGRQVTFKSDVIPAEDYAKLHEALSHCYTSAAVGYVFDEYDAHGVKALIDYSDEVPQSQLDMEREFTPKMQAFLLEDAQFIADMYNLTDELPQKKDEREKYIAFLIPFLTAWAITTIGETAAALGEIALPVTADVNALAAQWANKHALELAKGLTDTTFSLAKAEIEKSLLTGETPAQLTTRLADIIAPRWRAEMIAQTEISRAVNAAIDEIGKELHSTGAKVRYVYRTAADERVCPICSPMHGKVRAVNGEYKGGNRPPQHPRCRCREYIEVIE